MTEDFRELTSQLAKGLNFPGNSVCLITILEGEEYGNVRAKGNAISLTRGICAALDKILSEVSAGDAFECHRMICQSINADRERRLQKAQQSFLETSNERGDAVCNPLI